MDFTLTREQTAQTALLLLSGFHLNWDTQKTQNQKLKTDFIRMVTYFYPTNNKKIQPTREPQRTGPKETTLIIFHVNRHTWIKKFRIIVKNKKQCHRILLHSNCHFKSYTLEWYSDPSSRSTESVWNNEMIVMDPNN